MRTLSQFVFCMLSACLASSVAGAATPPLAAPIRPAMDDYFGTKVTDNYRYFEDLKNPEVQKWMKAQANYTRATLDALPGYAALLKRIDELNTSEPADVTGVQIVGGRYYSLRRPANAQSPKLYVRDDIKGIATPPTCSRSRCGGPAIRISSRNHDRRPRQPHQIRSPP